MISSLAMSQSETAMNKTDKDGKKQGHWIKKYPNGNVMYDGFFKDDQPVGEFRRYYDDKTLKSLLIFTNNGTEAAATIYYLNSFLAAKGKYKNQLKDGKWQFFSVLTRGCLISEEKYSKNLRNGLSLKYYPDSIVAERLNYVNDVRHGEWLQFYPNGSISLKANYLNGKVNGNFEAYFENGKSEFSGQYKGDLKDGLWRIYKNDGTIRYEIEYDLGTAKNRVLDIYESEYMDSLEKKKVKIADPEKTGVIW